MGRHSAVENDETVDFNDKANNIHVVPYSAEFAGRHARITADTDEVDETDTSHTNGAGLDLVADVDELAAVDPQVPDSSRGGVRADARLLRHNRALLARCIVAVLVPFLLYTLALLVIDDLSQYLLWLWIPAIVAGVAAGAFLDMAHRRARDRDSSAPVAG